MRHHVKKIKFKYGRDSHRMLMRKLVTNFLLRGTITATEKKIKALKSVVERLVHKAKEKTESNKNFLLRKLGDERLVTMLFEQVGPVVKNISGGYVKSVRLQERISDGALMVRMSWSYPVVIKNDETVEIKEKKKEKKSPVKESKT